MLESILKRIDAWKSLGFKESAAGSRIIAHTPRDFPEAYLHRFYAPRGQKIWRAYGFKLPASLKQLYSECNGFGLFHDAIAIYGIRGHYARDTSAQFEPFDIASHDHEHRMCWHPSKEQEGDQRVFFGSYGGDGSGIYVVGDLPEIYRVLRGQTKPSNVWPDLKEFLDSEYERISKLFTEQGYLQRKNASTVPSKKRRK